jgi:Zn-dependent M28 family amino/carboxypeptidase
MDEEGGPFLTTRYTVGTELNARLSSGASAQLFEGSERSYADVLSEAQSGENSPRGFALPLEVTIGQKSIHDAAESRNVLAILRGSDAKLANEYVVITCHLDHVGIGPAVDGDSIYNGAMDNATGVAFMLELARVLALAPDRPKRSVLFYATTAEEHGLIGSSYFVNNPTVPLGNIVANINVDAPRMFFPFDEITAFGAEHATLKSSIREAVESMGYALDKDIRFETGASDHFSFLRAGVPGTRVIPAMRSSDPNIDAQAILARYRPHTPSDDLSLPFDYEIGAEFTGVLRTIVRRIADAESRPQWIEGDPLSR